MANPPTTPAAATADAPKIYLTQDTKRMLKMVDSGLFKQHPFGEFLVELADQLRLADTQINSTGMAGLHTEMKLDKAKKEITGLETIVVQMREEIRILKSKVPVDAGEDVIG